MSKHPLVFVIDDDLLIQKLIKADLKALKMDVMTFGFGEECLPEMYLKPDLVILDYIFVGGEKKVLSGFEILQEIRNINQSVPVIVLSGQDSGNAVLELIKLGIEEYIIKEEDFISKLRESVLSVVKNF